MRRARHNVELLIRRLDLLHYRFGIPKPRARQIPSPPIEERIANLRRERPNLSPTALAQVEDMMRRQDAERRAAAAHQAGEEESRHRIADHLADKSVFNPPDKRVLKRVDGMEKQGLLLPLSLRAWIEQVGQVCLIGTHPRLCFFEGVDFPGIYADPFMLLPDPHELEGWREETRERNEITPLDAVVGWTAQAKARIAVENEQLDHGYAITLPDAAADAPLKGEPHGTTFVAYLRIVFRWGGFPGWEGQPQLPEAELKFLTDELLPI
jgi:hypothetical protein